MQNLNNTASKHFNYYYYYLTAFWEKCYESETSLFVKFNIMKFCLSHAQIKSSVIIISPLVKQ